MKLTNLIAAGLTATLLSTGVAYAQTTPATPAEVQVLVKNEAMALIPEVQAIVEALKAEGFTYIEIRRTMMGRAKVMAYGEDSMREVVLNPNTGEILRNIVREHDGSMAQGMEAMQELRDQMEEQMGGSEGGMGDGGNMDGGNDGGMGGGNNGGMGGGNGGGMGGN